MVKQSMHVGERLVSSDQVFSICYALSLWSAVALGFCLGLGWFFAAYYKKTEYVGWMYRIAKGFSNVFFVFFNVFFFATIVSYKVCHAPALTTMSLGAASLVMAMCFYGFDSLAIRLRISLAKLVHGEDAVKRILEG